MISQRIFPRSPLNYSTLTYDHAIELINTTSTWNRFEHSSMVYMPYILIEHYIEHL